MQGSQSFRRTHDKIYFFFCYKQKQKIGKMLILECYCTDLFFFWGEQKRIRFKASTM